MGYINIKERVKEMADQYAEALKTQIEHRILEMESDDKSHYVIYRALGISVEEGDAIDIYQNKGRFLYRYAGTFLENAAKLCFEAKFQGVASLKIPNTIGRRPRTFEIDCLIDHDAYEIKWRDATTDGDHITKEHTRLRAVVDAGYHPIRVMFYYPNRAQAMRIQSVLRDLYEGMNGHYYQGDDAWNHIKARTDIDLKQLLTEIADERGI